MNYSRQPGINENKNVCLSTSVLTTIKRGTETGINIQCAKLIVLLKEVKVTEQL